MDLLKAEIEKKRKQLEDANLLVSNIYKNIVQCTVCVPSYILIFINIYLLHYIK